MGHRHPTPGDVKTTDAPRLLAAWTRCLERLLGDPRMESPYRAWLAWRDILRLEQQALAAWKTPRQQQHTDALFRALWRVPDPGEVESLSEVLRGWGVPWPWCAPALLTTTFPQFHSNQRLPDDPMIGGPEIRMVDTATPGRRPRDDGDGIRLCVDTWYRGKIQQPPVSLVDLEREDLARNNQTTVSRRHSTILQRIQQAEDLLGIWEVGSYRPAEFY